MSIDYRTKDQVQEEARNFRVKHSAMDWSVGIDDLIKLRGFAHGRYSQIVSLGAKLRASLNAIAKKMRAMVSLQESVILVADDLPEPKKPFAKGHELGHAVLPWHKEILYVCDEHDLSPATRAQMEYEANEFSAEVILPKDLLSQVYGQYPTNMETVLLLKQWTGASIEMSATMFVKHHPGKCLLIVLRDAKDDKGNPVLRLERKTVSQAASSDVMSTIARRQDFGINHVLYTNSRSKGTINTCALGLHGTTKRFSISLMNNGYAVLALVTDQ